MDYLRFWLSLMSTALSAHDILEHWLMLMTLCYWPLLPGQSALLKICDKYAEGFDIVFNANKSKCIFIRAKRNVSGPVVHMPFSLLVASKSSL